MKEFIRSVMQLITLSIGIGIGLLISPRIQRAVAQQANTVSKQDTAAVQSSSDSSSTVQDPYKPQPVTPVLGVPSMGANLILVHQLEADKVVVNGYDLLKLDQGILEYLARQPLANQFSISEVVSNSRAADIHTIAQAQQKPPVQSPK